MTVPNPLHSPSTYLPTPEPQPPADLSLLIETLRANVAGVFLGKDDVIRMAIVALLADGHLLLEDVPGVGKTLLAKALSRSLNCKFNRIQFTPDLLPADLTGTSIYNQSENRFEFQPGPIFAEVIVADEINRATPRTQSALLEAMSERQVTLDGTTRKLGPPFLVLATQNPYEFEGTYALPESQLDRFLLRVSVGYPSRESERAILSQHRSGEPIDRLLPVLQPSQIVALQAMVRNIKVDPLVADYLLDLIEGTRKHPNIALGASTRAALAFYRATQAYAMIAGKQYVSPDDVKTLAIPVLAHRIVPKAWDQAGRADTESLIQEILKQVPVPI